MNSHQRRKARRAGRPVCEGYKKLMLRGNRLRATYKGVEMPYNEVPTVIDGPLEVYLAQEYQRQRYPGPDGEPLFYDPI